MHCRSLCSRGSNVGSRRPRSIVAPPQSQPQLWLMLNVANVREWLVRIVAVWSLITGFGRRYTSLVSPSGIHAS